jgi:hypothetical protein
MAYFALILGVAALTMAITGKRPPWKQWVLYDPPPAFRRAVFVWLGLLFSGFGIFLLVEAHRN